MNEELESISKVIVKYIDFIKSKYRPAFDHFTTEIEPSIKEFLFLEEAKHKLDEEARTAGFDNAAHQIAVETRKENERRADEAAKAKAVEDARKKEEDDKLKAIFEEERKLKEARDLADAELQAKKIAIVNAGKDAEELERKRQFEESLKQPAL